MTSSKETVVKFVPGVGADKKLRELNANEVVFAVVGPVGSGTSWVALALSQMLSNVKYEMDVHVIKASEAINNWVNKNGLTPLVTTPTFAKVASLQDAGDEMRKADLAA